MGAGKGGANWEKRLTNIRHPPAKKPSASKPRVRRGAAKGPPKPPSPAAQAIMSGQPPPMPPGVGGVGGGPIGGPPPVGQMAPMGPQANMSAGQAALLNQVMGPLRGR